MSFLRFLMLLAVAVWLGALVFFPAVAQTAFTQLPSVQFAGLVVRGSLIKLHWLGMICGSVFLVCSVIYNPPRFFNISNGAAAIMMVLTAISQFVIIPKMDALRAAAGEIASLPAESPVRSQFDSLHAASTRIEGAVLLLGILVLYLTSRRLSASPRA